MDKQLCYWLAATRIPGLGPRKLQKLVKHLGSIQALFELSSLELASLHLPLQTCQAILQPDWSIIEPIKRWGQQPGCHIIAIDSAEYPVLLKEIIDPPTVLFLQGQVELLNEPHLAIVGSRNPSPLGREIAHYFANQWAGAGFGVASGLALGIDAAAHQGALAAQGKTLAVFGTGLARIYPARNRQLAQQIAQQGLLVSEFFPDVGPVARHFPQRNRIISGLSLGVLVVEAAVKSGSLITARYALEQGREVFAIPGSIHNPLARGCHMLLRQGATLVEHLDDILTQLGGLLDFCVEKRQDNSQFANSEERLSADQLKIVASIDAATTSMDQLQQRTQIAPQKLAIELINLEMRGYIHSVVGGYARCR